MKRMLSLSFGTGYQTNSAWHEFWMTLRALNRRAELLRLICWAKRKRLDGPLRAYRARLEDEELRLIRFAIRFPRPTQWAYRIHYLNNLLFPAPRYFSRGAAPKSYSKYKKRWKRKGTGINR